MRPPVSRPLRVVAITLSFFISLLVPVLQGKSAPSGRKGPFPWTVVFHWPGMEVEPLIQRLALPLEEALEGLVGLVSLNIALEAGELRAEVLLKDWETGTLLHEIAEALHMQLPPEVPRPLVSSYRQGDEALYIAALDVGEGPARGPAEALRLCLEALDGVGECELMGLSNSEILILPDETLLTQSRLSLSAFVTGLRDPLRPLPAGRSRGPDNEELISLIPLDPPAISPGQSLPELATLRIEGFEGLQVEDYARILRHDRQRGKHSLLNARPIMLLSLSVDSKADPRRLSREIAASTALFLEEYTHCRLEVLLDRGREQEEGRRLLLGAAAVSLFLVFAASALLCSLRAERGSRLALSLLCAGCVPINMGFTLLCALVAGFKAEAPLLTALSIASGFVADSFLVSMEAVLSVREISQCRPALRSLEKVLLASAGTTLIALIPVCTIARAELSMVAWTLFISTLVSFPLSRFFLVPLSLHLIFQPRPRPVSGLKGLSSRPVRRLLAAVSRRCYHRRRRILLAWVVFSLLCILCIPRALDSPGRERRDLVPVLLSFEAGTPEALVKERTARFSLEVLEALGNEATVWASLSPNSARVSVRLDTHRITIRELLSFIESYRLEGGFLHSPRETRGQYWWQVHVLAQSSRVSRDLARELAAILFQEEGVTGVVLNFPPDQGQLRLEIDRAALLRGGMNAEGLGLALRRLLSGIVVGKYLEEGREMDIRLSSLRDSAEEGAEPDRLLSLKELRHALVTAGEGRVLALGELVTMGHESSPSQIERKERRSVARLSFSSTSPSVARAESLAKKAVSKISLPFLSRAVFDPEALKARDEQRRLVLLMLAASLFCSLFLALCSNSSRDPLLCLLALLPALLSAFPALLLARERASPSALCASVLLAGLAINACILSLEALKGRTPGDRTLYRLLRSRLAVLFSSTATSVLSCLPFLFLPGEQTVLARELAVVCIAGILVASASSLCLLPFIKGFGPLCRVPYGTARIHTP